MSAETQCPEYRTIRLFADGELDKDTMERLRPHVESCHICRATLAQFDSQFEAPQITEDWVPKGEDKFDPGILTPSARPGSIGRLGDYDVLRVIGSGGMGVVLEGYDEYLERPVAIKVLARQIATSKKARGRFTREARAVAAVKHSNIVTIHAVDEQKGVPFIVMEYVRGQTLHDKIAYAGKLNLLETLRISNQIAEGLAAAHEQGVIHRDIKPANIMLESNLERVKIADFGLARVAVDNSELTSLGETVGTPAFMSPEQVSGDDLDEKTDLFSLGVVMYAMLSGYSPFQGTNLFEGFQRVCNVTPEPLYKIAECPRQLSDLVDRLLAKSPKDRIESAQQVASILVSQLSRFNQADTQQTQQLLKADLNTYPSKTAKSKWIAIGGLVAVISAGIAFVVYNSNSDSKNLGGDSSAKRDKLLADPLTTDPKVERAAADWVFDVGGIITIRTGGRMREITSPQQLPSSEFWIEHVDLAQCVGIDDQSLKILEGLVRLNYLQLNGSDVTDAGLKRFSKLVSLRYLGLKSTSISDVGLAHLAELQKLTRLNLMGTRITDQGFSHLQGVTTLNSLYLANTNLGDDVIPYFAAFKDLHTVELNNTQLSDKGLRRLAAFQSLESLYVNATDISDQGVPHLLLMRNLRILNVEGTQLSQAKIRELVDSLPECDVLGKDGYESSAMRDKVLAGPLATDPQVEKAAAHWVIDVGGIIKIRVGGRLREITSPQQLPSSEFWIEHVDLAQCVGVDDESIKKLEGLVRLHYLQLSGTDVTNEGLSRFSGLVNLRYLGLKSTLVSDEGLAHLATLQKLTRVNLMDTRITDRGFSHLQGIATLNSLYLGNTNLGDDVIPYFANFKDLHTVELKNTKLSDKGLRRLAAFQTLAALYLSGTHITDEGVPHLLSMRNLRILDIEGTQLSQARIRELARSLPECNVLGNDG